MSILNTLADVVPGKPGIGKTVLCTAIIEDLKRHKLIPESSSDNAEGAAVSFYFFDKKLNLSNSPGHAFRAMLAQLLHFHRRNKQVIDVASVLLVESQTGQPCASNDDISAALDLLLQHVRHAFLVVDGIDECSDVRGFFERLSNITGMSRNCAIVLLSRPTIKIPHKVIRNPWRIDLKGSQNMEDIKSFLRPEIEELLLSGILPREQSLGEVVDKIVARANGMFLWVSLLLDYLRSEALTVHQRKEAIENLNRLEGLDALYGAILESIERKFPLTSRGNIRRLFQWVSGACRPLHVDELKVAVSLPLCRAQTSDDIIPKFEDSLGVLSGGLLELGSDKSVHFIHLSVLEYLTDTRDQLRTSRRSFFDLGDARTDRCLAIGCLSYLCRNIPAQPLGGSSQEDDVLHIQNRFPLLKYAAQFWSHHLRKDLRYEEAGGAGSPNNLKVDDGSLEQLSTLTTAFISQRSLVSVWIEASWLFGNPPQVEEFPDIGYLPHLNSLSDEVRNLVLKASPDLKRLSEDIKTLNKCWGHVLSITPSEIWKPSISAFTKSRFWLTVDGARLARLARPDKNEQASILIQSQLSENGLEIGRIKLSPPRELPRTLPKYFNNYDGWEATYELQSLRYNENIITVNMTLDSEVLSAFLQEATPSSKDKLTEMTESARFAFPTAISADLRKVVILNYVLKVYPPQNSFPSCNAEDVTQDNFHFQAPYLQSAMAEPCLLSSSPDEGNRNHRWNDSPNPQTFNSSFYLKLSSSGEYLAVLRDSRDLVKFGHGLARSWLIQVFRDSNRQNWGEPKFSCVASLIFFPVSRERIKNAGRMVTFHPFLPQLAFAEFVVGGHPTVIWNFLDSSRKSPQSVQLTGSDSTRHNIMQIDERAITEIAFSNDGSYLYGMKAWPPTPYEEHIFVRLDRFASPALLPYNANQNRMGQMCLLPNKDQGTNLRLYSTPAIQNANSIVFSTDHRGKTLSVLRQLRQEGAIILHQLCENGELRSETLSRLPKDISDSSSATLLASPRGECSDNIYIVLNKAPQEDYCLEEIEGIELPAVIERTRSSIQTRIRRKWDSLEEGLPEIYHKSCRRRIE